jgi:hypothetical protein
MDRKHPDYMLLGKMSLLLVFLVVIVQYLRKQHHKGLKEDEKHGAAPTLSYTFPLLKSTFSFLFDGENLFSYAS